MRLTHLAVPALALLLGMTGATTLKAQQGPPPSYGQGRWDAPPREFNQAQRQGFIDGIDGAQKDYGNHRQPNVNNRWEYTHPNMPRQVWDTYRDGFRRGYDRAMSHLMGPAYRPLYPMQPPQGPVYAPQGPDRGPRREAWEVPPSAFNNMQRRGFQDGIEGARKDYGNNRAPNVNNREEYRNTTLRGSDRRAYRDGFQRGYEMAASHLWSGGPRR